MFGKRKKMIEEVSEAKNNSEKSIENCIEENASAKNTANTGSSDERKEQRHDKLQIKRTVKEII